MTALYESLKTICKARRSIRHFAAEEVPAEAIEKIKAIASTSPYASNRKNWELLTVTGRKEIREIAGVVRTRVNGLTNQVREDFREDFSRYAENFTLFESAPVLIIPTFRISPGLSVMLSRPPGSAGDSGQQWTLYDRDNSVKSISCVTMLVLLAAQSLGLGGCYMTGPLIAETEIHRLINIKKGRNIGAIIPIGWPGSTNNTG